MENWLIQKKEISWLSFDIYDKWGFHLKPAGYDSDKKLVSTSSQFSILGNIRIWLIAKAPYQYILLLLNRVSYEKVLKLTWHYIEYCCIVHTVLYIHINSFYIIF